MLPIIVLAIQCILSLIIFFALAKWYLIPRITQDNKMKMFAFLLIINIFRYLPMSLYMPGQVATDFPEDVKAVIVYGDLLSCILALSTLYMLRMQYKTATVLGWVFSIISITDMILALSVAMYEKVYELHLGVNYFTVVVYVPLLMIVQALILKILLNKNIPDAAIKTRG
ncbi:MAG: hypothetical protein KDC07_12080 [Chitinophagaceae bacterium]|nr:hypothetical protein [Chitinophagaceae bacterium]MCB9047332.1 hypothetical protein [Chitinophagales bacterium]